MRVSRPSTVPYSSSTTATRDPDFLNISRILSPRVPFVEEQRQGQPPLDPKRLGVLVLDQKVLDLDDSQQSCRGSGHRRGIGCGGLEMTLRRISSGGSAWSIQTISLRGVISARARRSLKRKTRLIISCSPSSNTPALVPSCSRTEISSWVTGGSGLGRTPRKRKHAIRRPAQEADQAGQRSSPAPGPAAKAAGRSVQVEPVRFVWERARRAQIDSKLIASTINPDPDYVAIGGQRDDVLERAYQVRRQGYPGVDAGQVPRSVVPA